MRWNANHIKGRMPEGVVWPFVFQGKGFEITNTYLELCLNWSINKIVSTKRHKVQLINNMFVILWIEI